MALELYDSLTRKKRLFKPVKKKQAGVYVCGPTVYGHAHLGHAKSYVSFDCLVRYLRHIGYKVTYVQNITDVGHLTDDADDGEDKVGAEAQRAQKHPMEIAEYYTRSFFEDMDALNCLRPDISPRASGHVIEQIELTKTLLEKGFAYEVNGSVYFEVAKFDGYGGLSGRNVDQLLAGARVEVSAEKKQPADFALWKKAAPNHVMQWPSPWGQGFPGWHLECSAMGLKYLGPTLDIHGGGIENQFPHHDCEIAQSEAATGSQFVRYWLHNNMVTVDGRKMGKSLNNFVTLKQAFSGAHERLTRGYDPLAVRQLILASHYRSPLDFSDASLYAAQSGFDRINATIKELRNARRKSPAGGPDPETASRLKELRDKFVSAMDDDLNTSVALSVIFDMVRLARELLDGGRASGATLAAVEESFNDLAGGCLGLVASEHPACDERMVEDLIELAVQQREQARSRKDFSTADRIRDRLSQLGVAIEDRPQDTVWRRK